MQDYTVTVIIPTYRPDEKFRKLLERLRRQSVQPDRILILNTEQKFFPKDLEDWPGLEIHHISKSEFDHGGTRDLGAGMADSDILMFMTMDAVPADTRLIENLLRPFASQQVAAAYARQMPNPDCDPIEIYTRSFNYGQASCIKTAADLPRLGIKTFFCSNVCAAYRRCVYQELGGFEKHTIFNEDMIYAGKLIQAGKAIAYCADARVLHSHNYSGMQQLKRNFDLGVSQAEHPEIFQGIKSEAEGIRMVKNNIVWLLKNGQLLQIPKLIYRSGCKYLGYRLGKNYQKLPRRLINHCTMNPTYWNL
ncbi:MAG: glycosyltransferase [Lachnospiraceae bacterium]|nr:glycosyltransferase [Lachnospiraceae bacterium]